MEYDIRLLQQARCTTKQKQELVPVVVRAFTLAEKARREGLLALEDILDELDDAFFRSGLQLMINGTDPAILEDVLVTKMLFANRSGAELLKMILQTESVRSIQTGDNPTILAIRLCAFFGDDAEQLKQLAMERINPEDPEKMADHLFPGEDADG